MIRTLFLSVVPSPYQRDIFRALARRPELKTKVLYLGVDCKGYPWPLAELEPWEEVLPGKSIGCGVTQTQIHTQLPDFAAYDVVVLNIHLPSLMTQWVMRKGLGRYRWMFWGERLRKQESLCRRAMQRFLAAPLRRASAIAAIGSLASRDYMARFPGRRVFNIPYHCNLSRFVKAPRGKKNSKEVNFLFCGVMNRRKGVDLLLRAFDRLVASGADVKLHLVGQEAELPSFLKQVTPQSRSRVQYEGFQAPDNLPDYFAQADVFVLPSRHDGWGVVVNQALGAGLPIVCSDAVGAGFDLIEPEVNGLRFPSEDEDGLFQSLRRFIERPEICEEWGAASRRKAQDWIPESGAAKWVEAIKEVARLPA